LPPFLRIDFKPTPAVSFITLLPFWNLASLVLSLA
jgi:hypothetical protein